MCPQYPGNSSRRPFICFLIGEGWRKGPGAIAAMISRIPARRGPIQAPRLRVRRIEVWFCCACVFEATLFRVVDGIVKSLIENPRNLKILFANPDDFEQILRADHSLPRTWITSAKDIPWPHFEQDTTFGNLYRVYSIKPIVS